VRRQNGHYNRSTSNTEGLVKTLVHGKAPRKPAKEVVTRWNSTLAVLSRWYVTSPHQKVNRDKCIKALRGTARSRAKNPVTDELVKVVGQVSTIGTHVLAATSRCEGNDSTLLSGAITILLLYKSLQAEKWLMPTSPDDVLATGQKDIEAIAQGTAAVVIDDILFKAAFIRYAVRTRLVLSATARLPSDRPSLAISVLPPRQDLAPEAQVLVDVFSEQIRQRYLDDDLSKHKHILFDNAVLKQLVLYPNGSSLMTKLSGIAGASAAQGRAAFDKGKDLILELCGRLEGPTLRVVSQQPNALASAPAPARSFHPDLSLDDSGEEGGAQPARVHASQASDAAREELARFLAKDDFAKIPHDKVLDWWTIIGKADYPNLRLVALSTYGAFPSSAEAEREFSTAGKDATASRSGLSPVFLRILSYLSLNSQRLRDITKDNELIKKIKQLDAKTRRDIKLGIESMWAQEDDDAADPVGPPTGDEQAE
jgi:hypothetical protein